jgi:hypothetical protein
MNTMLEAGKEQFRDLMSRKLNVSEIPEWLTTDGKPSLVYFKPSMNFRDQGEVLKLHSENKQAEAVVMTFILRALDKNGDKLFKRSHLTEFMQSINPEIVSRVVSEMGGDDADMEDAIKN